MRYIEKQIRKQIYLDPGRRYWWGWWKWKPLHQGDLWAEGEPDLGLSCLRNSFPNQSLEIRAWWQPTIWYWSLIFGAVQKVHRDIWSMTEGYWYLSYRGKKAHYWQYSLNIIIPVKQDSTFLMYQFCKPKVEINIIGYLNLGTFSKHFLFWIRSLFWIKNHLVWIKQAHGRFGQDQISNTF